MKITSNPFTPIVADGSTRFALDLYSRMRRPDENLIFSPFSVFAALAMALTGARGETAGEMASTLRLAPDPEQIAAVGELLRDLVGAGESRPYQLNIANALWGRSGYPFLPQFLESMREHFGAGLQQADFERPEEACRIINDWVAAQTQGKIPDLLSPDCINELTQLILTNAIYFKGSWLKAFDKDDTTDRPFLAPGGKKLQVPTMTQEGWLRYHDAGTFQAAEFPYRGDRLAMAVFLPRPDTRLEAFEEQLTATGLAESLAAMRRQELRVYLPKFEIRSACQLADTLKAMGMGRAFGSGADFSGMDGGRLLAIAEAIHQAYVDVNEEGTEAAAATALTMDLLSDDGGSGPITFRADRPFLFLIRDTNSGSILFLGRVANPAGRAS